MELICAGGYLIHRAANGIRVPEPWVHFEPNSALEAFSERLAAMPEADRPQAVICHGIDYAEPLIRHCAARGLQIEAAGGVSQPHFSRALNILLDAAARFVVVPDSRKERGAVCRSQHQRCTRRRLALSTSRRRRKVAMPASASLSRARRLLRYRDSAARTSRTSPGLRERIWVVPPTLQESAGLS